MDKSSGSNGSRILMSNKHRHWIALKLKEHYVCGLITITIAYFHFRRNIMCSTQVPTRWLIVFKVSAFFIAHVTSSFKCKVLFSSSQKCFVSTPWHGVYKQNNSWGKSGVRKSHKSCQQIWGKLFRQSDLFQLQVTCREMYISYRIRVLSSVIT